jgi:NAD(P)-dependent dehydrogenase (short-subunit alcohol dehydrogenase family)
MKTFRGRTAVITGGASGIGLGMARAFGRAGMNVVLADIDEAQAEAAADSLRAEQIRAEAVFCDVTDRAAVRAAALEAVATFGKIHLVCNNAGGATGGLLGAVKPSDWEWVVDVNVMGVIHGVETFAPLILSHGEGGHILNTASIMSFFSAGGVEPYSGTKYAVIGMTEGWAQQLGPRGVGVSALCPAFVRTRFNNSQRNRQPQYGGAAPADSAEPEMIPMARDLIEAGIDPDIVGARALEGVQGGELYIFTDPRWGKVFEARFEAIRTALNAAAASEAMKAVKDWPAMPSFAR